MKSALPAKDLLRISWTIETGLKSGRDWISVLRWISEKDPEKRVRSYLQYLCLRLKIDSVEKTLKEERDRWKDLLWRLFIEILMQAHLGAQNLSQVFATFSEIGNAIQKVKIKEKSLLFIPKFQSFVSLTITLGFTL